MRDQGSKLRVAEVQLQGVPTLGLVDTGADITIMGGELFKKVAAAARLKKNNFKGANISPCTYMGQRFKLDGWMDRDVQFDGKTMCTLCT